MYATLNKSHIIVGERGTVVSDLEDLGNDGRVVMGNLHNARRFKEEDAFIGKLKKEFPDSRITITGHSLGGSYASRLAHKHGIEAYAWNEGSAPNAKNLLEHIRHKRDGNIQ